MAQESVAEALATFVSAFDEAGNVGEDIAARQDSEVRNERGEGVRADLGARIRERIQEAGLAGIRQADQAGIGDEVELDY